MTVLTHMAVGGAVGTLVGGTGAAFGTGVLSHVPLDVIPHYDFPNVWVELGLAVAFLGSMLALGLGVTPAFWGALGGVLPDLENLLWRVGVIPGRLKVFPGHAEWFKRFVPHGRSLGPAHLWWQVVMIAVCMRIMFLGVSL